MLKLYHLPISFNSRRVWVALLEKKLDFQLISLKLDGDQFQPEFLALNPFHHIPVLVDEDITVIESLAILDYIEAKYANPPLIYHDPILLAKIRMIEMVTINELLPATRPLIQNTMELAEVSSEKIEQSQQQIVTVLNYLTIYLGDNPYLVGDRLTLADIVAGTTIPILPSMGMPLDEYPAITNWVKHLRERESWQQTEPSAEDIEVFKATMKKLMNRRNIQ